MAYEERNFDKMMGDFRRFYFIVSELLFIFALANFIK